MGNYKTSHSKVILALVIISISLAAATKSIAKKQSKINGGGGGLLSRLVNYNRGIDTSPFVASKLSHKRVHSKKGLTKENDIITSLPGQPKVDFKQYGGYVTVDEQAGRALYYYFVEAQHSASALPLLLWLKGGPGCSSLGYGAMQELGPFRVLSDGKTLIKNKFAWNYAANVLFLESPAGVGFSYSNSTSDIDNIGDKQTAEDGYAFLVNWLERFPEYRNRDFYIAGDGYAGHFAPQLALTILHQNHHRNKIPINLHGIIIGNAVINYETDTKGQLEYWGSHALISDDVARQALTFCDFSPKADNQSDKCLEAIAKAVTHVGKINVYNIYAALCSNSNLTDKPNNIINSATGYDPCSENYVYAYLNTPNVQKALHVTDIPIDWEFCSDVVNENWQDSPNNVLPLLREVMALGLRVWIYSGDVDGVIPVTSTQRSIETMKLAENIKTPWYPWYNGGEVGGYAQVYENLTFATVRGAGHEVPMYESKRALSLIMHFLAGTPPPG